MLDPGGLVGGVGEVAASALARGAGPGPLIEAPQAGQKRASESTGVPQLGQGCSATLGSREAGQDTDQHDQAGEQEDDSGR